MLDESMTPPVESGGGGKDDEPASSGASSLPPQKVNKAKNPRRHRDRLLAIRLSTDEHHRVFERADKTGLTVGAFARHQLLGETGPRARKRAPADRQELVRLLGAVNRVGNNLNQIAHALNANQGFQPASLESSLEELRQTTREIRAALGHDPDCEPDGPDVIHR